MPEICQTNLPLRPWAAAHTQRLPGVRPVAPGEWLQVDEAYGAQMAYREQLLAEKGEAVLRLAPEARAAASELLDAILEELAAKPGFRREGDAMLCPDGRRVALDFEAPLETAARLVQEDLLILQKPEGAEEHILTGGVLCFPASWTLAEKFGSPLTRIHVPVPQYDEAIARRVQRLFDALRVEQPIFRANALLYADPDLHQPRSEAESHRLEPEGGPRWFRMERQTLKLLEKSRAVIFSIHSYVFPWDRLSPEDRAGILEMREQG